MELFRHELKKMLFNKKSILIFIALVLIPVITNIADTLSYYNENGSPSMLYDRYKPYEGVIREDVADKSKKELERLANMQLNDRQAFENYNKQDRSFLYDYNNAADMALLYKSGKSRWNNALKDNQLNPKSLAGVNERIAQLKAAGRENTYEYRQRVMQLGMILEAGTPGFYFSRHWKALFSFITGGGPVFIIMIILLLASPTFSKEYSTGMDSIIFSSRKGRGSIAAAKTFAALVMAIITILFFSLAEFLCYVIPGTFINWDAPLNSLYTFFATPFDINILEYLLIHTAYQLLGGIVLTLVTLFFSSRFKSSLVTFFTGMCFAFYPSILFDLLKIRTDWSKIIKDISVASALKTNTLFDGFYTYNLFGTPVLLLYIVPVAITAFGIASIILTYFSFKKRDAC